MSQTQKCQSSGKTCVLGGIQDGFGPDGSACCSGRSEETRSCVPCDETKLKKPSGSVYTMAGSCNHVQGTYFLFSVFSIIAIHKLHWELYDNT